MRTLRRILIPSLASALAVAQSDAAFAQVDVEPPMPNVMIMLDSSGSMSHKMDGSDPVCPADPDLAEVRWFALVQALTGSVPAGQLACNEVDRSSPAFATTYGSPSDTGYYLPYYQMTSTGGCALVPNPLYRDWNVGAPESAINWYDFPINPAEPAIIGWNGTARCDFAQQNDGIIDTYKRTVRFGLMTFDPLVDPKVGVNSGSDPVVLTDGFTGGWSYWYTDSSDNWYDGGSGAAGMPVGCTSGPLPMEVGARGPAAPPWEGRLMGFGYEKATASEVEAQNERIEKVIGAMRPYGATPLAGMMSDLKDLVLNEEKMIPGGPGKPDQPLGAKWVISPGYGDTLWQEGGDDGCRPFHVIIITDGEPNLDLRPDCVDPAAPNPSANCPFAPIVDSANFPADGDTRAPIVNSLNNNNKVIFHVIGVALDALTDPAGANCTDAQYQGGPAGIRCIDPTISAQEKTCCLLNAMQYEGNGGPSGPAGNETATFVQNSDDLKSALGIVLTRISSGTATRTTPVFQAVSPKFFGGTAPAVGHQVRAALETTGSHSDVDLGTGDVLGGLWTGRLERQRIDCDDTVTPPVPTLQNVDDTKGDSFTANMSNFASDATRVQNRFMITAVSADVRSESWRSLRPELPSDLDGMGQIDIEPIAQTALVASTWVDAPEIRDAMNPAAATCLTDLGIVEASPFTDCAAAVLNWYVGLGPTTDVAADRRITRTSPLGGIYHSQPVIVGPPREFVRDEAYDIFAQRYAKRPSVVYASSVDGQLHAFKMADNDFDDTTPAYETVSPDMQVDTDAENNELWSFVPPIALSELQRNFNRHALLLDGNVAVKNLPTFRVPGDAGLTSFNTDSQFRTFLVASSGRSTSIEGGGYYFALDVTDPLPEARDFDTTPDDVTTEPTLDAPKFLWQMSRSDAGTLIGDAAARLFGDSVPEAAITTIAYFPFSSDPGATPLEIPVAILAGGLTDDGPDPTTDVGSGYATATTSPADGNYALHSAASGPVRARTPLWPDPGSGRADRSITVVRLDTGEIIFRMKGQSGDPDGSIDTSRIRVGNFYAPMSGTPVAYPGLPGQISTRVFIGDADGILWSLDMSDPDPNNPAGGWRLEVAWDAYHAIAPSALIDPNPAVRVYAGPVETPPVVSVDDNDNPVVLFATGSQENFYTNRGTNYVVSVSGVPQNGVAAGVPTTGYQANWEIKLDDPLVEDGRPGQRVTGPLNLFDSVAYWATFVPSGEACAPGDSRIWGAKYVDAAGPSPTPPFAAPTAAVNLDTADVGLDLFVPLPGTTIFGVAVSQLPSCDVVGSDRNFLDENFGAYSSFTSAPPGQFQLVAMTGRPAPKTGDINSTGTLNGTDLKAFDFPLPQPQPVVKVDSWAAIVE